MSSILDIANTDLKRNLLIQSLSMYLSNLKCQLHRTKIGFDDKKIIVDKRGYTALDRLNEKIIELQTMLDDMRDEVFVG